MESKVEFILDWSKKISGAFSYLYIVIITVISIEVISRYLFNNPTSWSWVVNQHLFGVTVLFGGIYALLTNSHIRIEIFYNKFKPFGKNVVFVVTLLFFVLFMGALVWKGGLMASFSLGNREITRGIFPLPVYPLKTLIPLSAFLFLVIGVMHFFHRKIKRSKGKRS